MDRSAASSRLLVLCCLVTAGQVDYQGVCVRSQLDEAIAILMCLGGYISSQPLFLGCFRSLSKKTCSFIFLSFFGR